MSIMAVGESQKLKQRVFVRIISAISEEAPQNQILQNWRRRGEEKRIGELMRSKSRGVSIRGSREVNPRALCGTIIIFQVMPQQLRSKQSPKHYARISLKRRQNLVDLVLEKSYSIGRAAARLKIKLSTAKMIVKKYRDHGTFFEKKLLSKKKIQPQVLASSEEPQKEPQYSPADTPRCQDDRQIPSFIQPEVSVVEEKHIGLATHGSCPPFIIWNPMAFGGFPSCPNIIFPFGNAWHCPAFL